MTDVKMWGKDLFWGLGYEFDPQWLLTDEQKKLQKTLIDLCQTSMRENGRMVRLFGTSTSSEPKRPKILLVSASGMSADAVSCLGLRSSSTDRPRRPVTNSGHGSWRRRCSAASV